MMRFKNSYISFMLALLLLTPRLIYAQHLFKKNADGGKFLVRGTLIDSSTRLPIELATLALTKNDSSPAKAVLSSSDGSFKFELTEKGTYVLTVSFLGYQKHVSGPIQITDSGTTELGKIKLQAEAGVLAEVIVKSRKALVQNKGDKIVYNARGDISNKAGSASDVLRKAPMVTVDAAGNVKMRGSSSIKVLLNGLPSNILAKNLKEALKTIPANSIESIEVITTPSAKYEAEGAAGVINIITKRKAKGVNGNIELSVGNLDQSAGGGLNVAAGKFNFNVSLNASRERERNVSGLSRISINNGQQIGRLTQRTDALEKNRGTYGDLTAEFRPDSSQKIGATASFWNGQWPQESNLYNLYESNIAPAAYNQISRQSGKFGQTDLSLNYQKKFRRAGQELQFIGQYSTSKDQSDYFTRQFKVDGTPTFIEKGPNNGRGTEMSFQADYAHPLNHSAKNLVEGGLRFSKTNSSSKYTVSNNLSNPGSEYLTIDPARSDNMKYFQDIFAGYVSLKFETSNNWSFRPGVRLEGTRMGGEFAGNTPRFTANFVNVVPSALITKKLNDQHNIKLNYTERIRRPWIWDLNPYVDASDPRNLSAGNPHLRPELTRMLEAGHSYTAASGFSMNSSLYFNTNSNAIESFITVDNQGVSRSIPQNIASNKRLGTNVFVDMEINSEWTLNSGIELYHVWFKSNALAVRNDASFYAVTLNSAYMLPRDYVFQVGVDYSNGYVTLQGRNSADYNYRFSARKGLLKNKASITLTVNNPFQNNFLQRSFATAPTFQSTATDRYYNRSITLSFSWLFGGLRVSEPEEKRFPDQTEKPLHPGKRGK